MTCWRELFALSQPFLGVFGDLCVGVVMLPNGSEGSEHVSKLSLWRIRLANGAIVFD